MKKQTTRKRWPGKLLLGIYLCLLIIFLIPDLNFIIGIKTGLFIGGPAGALLLTLLLLVVLGYRLSIGESGRLTPFYKKISKQSKLLANTSILLLVASTCFAIVSLSFYAVNGPAYTYNSIANGFDVLAILLLVCISHSQQNLFWFSASKKINLDERQLLERGKVIDVSYRIGSRVVLISIVVIGALLIWLPRLRTGDMTPTLPVTYLSVFWIAFNLVLFLLALPVFIASYTQKRSTD